MQATLQRLFTLPLARNLEAGALLETFLVSAVVSLLAIRGYLELTGYPQIGGHGLHIAHMLWGGLLLVVGLVLTLAFIGRRVRYLAAIVGGVGFGTFIDELGKFITSDNDYFYQPTIAIIYIVFVLLFLTFRAIPGRRPLTVQEQRVNALGLLQDLRLRSDDRTAYLRLHDLLARLAPSDPDRAALVALAGAGPAPPPGTAWIWRMRHDLAAWYERAVTHRWFQRAVLAVFLLHALAPFLVAAIVVVAVIWGVPDANFELRLGEAVLIGGDSDATINLHPAGPAALFDDAAAVLAWALTMIGVVCLRRSRLVGYLWFKRSLLVSILLVRVFAFYEEQLGALVGLVVDLALLVALDYMIAAEQAMISKRERTAAASAPASVP